MKILNNDQKIRKGHKNVQNLGNLASTALIVELENIIKKRIEEVKSVIKNNESATTKEPYKTEWVDFDGGKILKSTRTDFECCNDLVRIGMSSNEETLEVLDTFLRAINLEKGPF